MLYTNVVSELMRPESEPLVESWLARQAPANVFLTAISEAELRYGVSILPHGRRRKRLESELEAMIRQDFAARILPFDSEAAQAYAALAAERRAAGQPIDQADAQIAAITPLARHDARNPQPARLQGLRDRVARSVG